MATSRPLIIHQNIYHLTDGIEFRKLFVCSIWRNIEPCTKAIVNVSHHHFLLVSFLFIIIHRGMWRHNSITQPPSWKNCPGDAVGYKKSSLFFPFLPRAYIGDNRRLTPHPHFCVSWFFLLLRAAVMGQSLRCWKAFGCVFSIHQEKVERYKRSNSQHFGRNITEYKKRISGYAS